MRIVVVLHVQSGDLLLFEGPAHECPPIPRAGDEISHGNHRVRLEGIQYTYNEGQVKIALLA